MLSALCDRLSAWGNPPPAPAPSLSYDSGTVVTAFWLDPVLQDQFRSGARACPSRHESQYVAGCLRQMQFPSDPVTVERVLEAFEHWFPNKESQDESSS